MHKINKQNFLIKILNYKKQNKLPTKRKQERKKKECRLVTYALPGTGPEGEIRPFERFRLEPFRLELLRFREILRVVLKAVDREHDEDPCLQLETVLKDVLLGALPRQEGDDW
jgi:hypothetical protein